MNYVESMQDIIKKIAPIIDFLYTFEWKLHVILKILVDRKI